MTKHTSQLQVKKFGDTKVYLKVIIGILRKLSSNNSTRKCARRFAVYHLGSGCFPSGQIAFLEQIFKLDRFTCADAIIAADGDPLFQKTTILEPLSDCRRALCHR